MKNILVTLAVVLFISGSLPIFTEGAELSGPEKEKRLGNLFDLYATESFVMLENDDITKRISRIVQRVAAASESPDALFSVRVINDPLPLVSSFSGYIYVSTGMLDIIENEDELAAMLAHAVAHAVKKHQHDKYVTSWNMKALVMISNALMPFLAITGAGASAAGAVAAGGAAAGEAIVATMGVSFGVSMMAQGIAGKQMNVPEKKVVTNRIGPYLYYGDPKTTVSAFVFYGEVYAGYKDDKEVLADRLALNYLSISGYRQEALASVLNKLLKLRDGYVNNGYVSHVFTAGPGLEERIKNADKIIKNHK